MPSKRSSSSAVAEAPLSAADVPWIHPELAASAIAAGGAGGLGLIAVSDLANDPSNVRRHGEKNHEATRASLRKFGQRTPIVVQKQGMVVRAGNDRLAIFREEGWSHIVALVVNENDVEATAYAIADNRTAELAEWDDDALARQLDALQKQGIDLDGLGFDLDDLDELDLGELEPDADLDDNGPEEPPVTPVSRPGDLWILGDHRLLCGDSTNPDDVARVLAGDRPPLLSTDPPYCVNYTGADRPAGVDGKPSGKDWSHVYREVDIKDLGAFLDGVLAACLPFVAEDAPIYMWHAHVQQPTIAAAFERHDLLLHQVVVWVKPCAVFGHSYFRWRHEPCAFGWRKGHKPTHGTAQLDTVWEADWEGKARVVGNEHPTQKPLRLFEIPMELHTKRGDPVFEPFSGSGSQMMAAEKLGRRCRAIDLSPAFIDAAIRRWQRATGRQAVLDGDGRTYEAVMAERLLGTDGEEHDACGTDS